MPAYIKLPVRRSSLPTRAPTSSTAKSTSTAKSSKPYKRPANTDSKKLTATVLQDLRKNSAKTQKSLDNLITKNNKPLLITECPAAPVVRSPASLERDMKASSSSSKDDAACAHALISSTLKEIGKPQPPPLIPIDAAAIVDEIEASNEDEDVIIEDSDPEDLEDCPSISTVHTDDVSVEIPDSPPVRPLMISPLQAVNNNPSPQPQAVNNNNNLNLQPQAANNNPSPQPQAANNNLNPQPQEQSSLRLLINHGLINPITIIDRLVAMLGPNSFTNKVVSENLLIFEAHSKENMDKLVAFFKSKRLPMTINPVDGKTRKYIIRNLNPRIPIAWIQAQLINLGFSPKGIHNMQGGKPRGPTNDFRVDIIHSKGGPNILDLKKLGTFSVTVIEMTGKKIYQCFNCQKFDHKVTMCPYPGQICFRCAGDHSGNECLKSLFSDATCTNCGGNHVASFPDCPVYAAARAKQERSRFAARAERAVHLVGLTTEADLPAGTRGAGPSS